MTEPTDTAPEALDRLSFTLGQFATEVSGLRKDQDVRDTEQVRQRNADRRLIKVILAIGAILVAAVVVLVVVVVNQNNASENRSQKTRDVVRESTQKNLNAVIACYDQKANELDFLKCVEGRLK